MWTIIASFVYKIGTSGSINRAISPRTSSLYAASIPFILGTTLLLGSWYGILLGWHSLVWSRYEHWRNNACCWRSLKATTSTWHKWNIDSSLASGSSWIAYIGSSFVVHPCSPSHAVSLPEPPPMLKAISYHVYRTTTPRDEVHNWQDSFRHINRVNGQIISPNIIISRTVHKKRNFVVSWHHYLRRGSYGSFFSLLYLIPFC